VDVARLRKLLDAVRAGRVDVEQALAELRDLPFADLEYATVDHHRALRQGVPEVILGQGKTSEQIAGVARELVRTGQNVLVTRINPEQAANLAKVIPETRYVSLARVATIEVQEISPLPYGSVALVCAGTADLPVVEGWARRCGRSGFRSSECTTSESLDCTACWDVVKSLIARPWPSSWRGWR